MRNELRIWVLPLVLVSALLLSLVPFIHAMADPASEPESGEQGTSTETQAESSKATRSEQPAEGGSEETPTDPFIPSESISADSAVSFPVDI